MLISYLVSVLVVVFPTKWICSYTEYKRKRNTSFLTSWLLLDFQQNDYTATQKYGEKILCFSLISVFIVQFPNIINNHTKIREKKVILNFAPYLHSRSRVSSAGRGFPDHCEPQTLEVNRCLGLSDTCDALGQLTIKMDIHQSMYLLVHHSLCIHQSMYRSVCRSLHIHQLMKQSVNHSTSISVWTGQFVTHSTSKSSSTGQFVTHSTSISLRTGQFVTHFTSIS